MNALSIFTGVIAVLTALALVLYLPRLLAEARRRNLSAEEILQGTRTTVLFCAMMLAFTAQDLLHAYGGGSAGIHSFKAVIGGVGGICAIAGMVAFVRLRKATQVRGGAGGGV